METETFEEFATRTSVVEECKRQLIKDNLTATEARNLLDFIHMQVSHEEYRRLCSAYENKDRWSTSPQVRNLPGSKKNNPLSLP